MTIINVVIENNLLQNNEESVIYNKTYKYALGQLIHRVPLLNLYIGIVICQLKFSSETFFINGTVHGYCYKINWHSANI
jgi:hypothetical protein